MGKNVTVIPATRQMYSDDLISAVTKRRTCGYARVSTDMEEQAQSYESQMTYYENYIKQRNDLEYVGMYSDEGITATSTKHRDGFNKMIDDALSGKIDLIITKSVSRFARNTVDSLTTVRKLKEKGVEVYFEKENIWTLDSKGELLITIMSSLAQEESRSISENTTWGMRKRMSDGHGNIAFTRFLGYDRGPNGEFIINEEQAEVVRRIFNEFHQGISMTRIQRGLERDGIKTVTGKSKWFVSRIRSILENEKYKGSCRMQKYYTSDYLTKKKMINHGELAQYYVEDHHPAIVSKQIFEEVQSILKSRESIMHVGTSDFANMVYCGDCGSVCGAKTLHSTDKYRKKVYRCNAKYKGEKCIPPAVDEKRLKEIFVEAVNMIVEDKDEIVENLKSLVAIKEEKIHTPEAIRDAAVEFTEAEKEYKEIMSSKSVSSEEMPEFEKKMKATGDEYRKTNERYKEMLQENTDRNAEINLIKVFLEKMESKEEFIEEYDYCLMKTIIDRFIINCDRTVEVRFLAGMKMTFPVKKE